MKAPRFQTHDTITDKCEIQARDYAKHRLVVTKRERALMHGEPFPEDEEAMDIDNKNIPGVDNRGRNLGGTRGNGHRSGSSRRRAGSREGTPMP